MADATPTRNVATGDDVTRENRRKLREGVVVSNAGDKTAVIEITERVWRRNNALHGLERLDQIKHAILENDSGISIVPRGS